MKSMGGEGKEKMKGMKNDKNMPQYGGEGSTIKKGGDHGLMHPEKMGKDYCGPGRYLGK